MYELFYASMFWNRNFRFAWKVSYVKWCFAGAHTGERASCCSKRVKEHAMKGYTYDATDSGRWSTGLVCSASLFFTNNTHVLVHLTQHCWAPLVVTLPLRETCQRTARGIPAAACRFCSLTPGQLASLAASSGLNCSCRFVFGACRGTELLTKTDWAHPQRTIAKQVHVPNILITFLFQYLCWVVG